MEGGIIIQCQKLGENAVIPTRSHVSDAGFDLYAAEDRVLYPFRIFDTKIDCGESQYFSIKLNKEELLISTQIAMEIPEGYFGKIEDRSSMALKGIKTAGGVIDSSYRGEIKVILYNHRSHIFNISQGDRIAQIIFHKIPSVSMIETTELKSSERGEGGFGSTGQ